MTLISLELLNIPRNSYFKKMPRFANISSEIMMGEKNLIEKFDIG